MVRYERVYDFVNGFAIIVVKDYKYGFMNEQGEEIVPPIYDNYYTVENQLEKYIKKSFMDSL
jgi:hypothetical protein